MVSEQLTKMNWLWYFLEYCVGGGGDNSVNHVNHPWLRGISIDGVLRQHWDKIQFALKIFKILSPNTDCYLNSSIVSPV